ncbi:C-terminal processing peptidase-3. Serine peptidase. MEROPS family S41A [Chitinophaga jiangningensis]|uniref:C-terminal processing peptidase-3. Serine peptidase. MEROPS family S41A n=2 Tax=Chitinophaga jiangningensis TaxID=1419482 RepID=A0A1M7HL94_9BACT|nr:C-terminal processing peptidase-3. Serine peptidase. MEROPS family S41A [Chitinophaga jiangningensis]
MGNFLTRKKKLVCGILVLLSTATGIFAFDENNKYFLIVKNLDIFAAFYRELDTYYVDDLPPEKTIQKGIEAILDETDPYTDFIAEENLDELKYMATGKYGGVGASINTNGEWTSITDIYPGSPMDKANVKPGDIIESMDGKSMKNIAQDSISKLLKGTPGTTIDIVFRHPLTNATTTKKIARQEINVKPVSYSGFVKNDIGYIKMTQFTENSGDMVRKAFEQLKRTNPGIKGIILDLRSNPGGLLDEAVIVANTFVDKNKLIVSTRGKVKNWDRTYETSGAPADLHIPLAVLTNHSSASAAEIVAGSMQDLDRGIIVGQRSYGKGLVQTTRSLPYNTKLKVTTAKYYTPSGRCIQAIDYSHRGEDGSVDYVADSMRKSFKTISGRTVKDGGGIEPDAKVDPTYLSPVAVSLLRKQFIFDYATQYYYSHPKIAAATAFSFSDADFEDFERFLENKDYSYKTRSEDALESFKTTARKEKYYDAVSKDLEELEQKLKHDKKQDLLKNKEEIKRLLEEEIVNRYYMMEGRIAKGLQSDNEVNKAIALLLDQPAYKKLLTPAK